MKKIILTLVFAIVLIFTFSSCTDRKTDFIVGENSVMISNKEGKGLIIIDKENMHNLVLAARQETYKDIESTILHEVDIYKYRDKFIITETEPEKYYSLSELLREENVNKLEISEYDMKEMLRNYDDDKNEIDDDYYKTKDLIYYLNKIIPLDK